MNYLSEEDLVWINRFVLEDEKYLGVQYYQGLSLVVNQPRQVVFGKELYPTIWLQAAFILQKITKKHIFFDGNKRTALVATSSFLAINRVKLTMELQEGIDFILYVTTSPENEQIMKVAAKWLQTHSQQD